MLEWIVVELFISQREDWTSNNESVKEKSGAHTTATPRIIFISGVLSLQALVGSGSGKHGCNCRERVKHRHGRCKYGSPLQMEVGKRVEVGRVVLV